MAYGTRSPIMIYNAEEITIATHGDEVPLDVCDGFRNGTSTAGDVKVRLNNGTDHTFKNVPTGGFIFCRLQKIYKTGTSLARVEKLFIE